MANATPADAQAGRTDRPEQSQDLAGRAQDLAGRAGDLAGRADDLAGGANAPAVAGAAAVGCAQLERWLAAGGAVLVDVREPFEHAAGRIAGGLSVPLGELSAASLEGALAAASGAGAGGASPPAGRRVVFYCRSGSRSLEAVRRLGVERCCHLAGGIQAWKASGRAVERPAGAPAIDVMRQVQVVAGALVAVGVALGWLVTPLALAVPAFVGLGLVFAGATGWCGLARVLALLPWNRACGARCAP